MKPRVALVSALKPVDEPRMYAKFARTLASGYEPHLIGFSPSAEGFVPAEGIVAHPLFSFTRLSGERLSASGQVYEKLKQIVPQAVIVHAVELLPVAARYCRTHGVPLLYDVQEDYRANLWHQRVYPPPVNFGLALAVRAVERACAPFVRHFLLAERCYAQDLPFVGERYTVLENKYAGPPPETFAHLRPKVPSPVRYVCTGTISEAFGALEAVRWVEGRQSQAPCTLTLAGRVASAKLEKELLRLSETREWLTLKLSRQPVAHRLILEQTAQAHCLLLPHRPTPALERRVPSKLYEARALGVRVEAPYSPFWRKLAADASVDPFWEGERLLSALQKEIAEG